MKNEQVAEIVKRYGGNFAGNGYSSIPTMQSANKGIYFDKNSNQNYTIQNGNPVFISPPSTQSQGFSDKVGAIASQTAKIAGGVALAAGKFVANTPKYVWNDSAPLVKPLIKAFRNDYGSDITNIRTQQAQLDRNMQVYTQAYKAGNMNKDQYATLMRDASSSFQDLSSQSRKLVETAQREGDPKAIALATANTAATILSAGTFKPISAAGAKAVGTGFTILKTPTAKAGLMGKLELLGGKLEKAMETVPAFRELVTRNSAKYLAQSTRQLAGETTGQFITRNSKDLAIGLLLKRPIIYQTNIGLAQDIYTNVLDGNYEGALKSAVWIPAQMVGGGPIGYFNRNISSLAGKLRSLTYGKGSFIDELSKQIGDGNPFQIARYLNILKEKAPKEFADVEKSLRIMQEVNLRASNDDVSKAVESVLAHYLQNGIDSKSIQPYKLVNDMKNWAKADDIAIQLGKESGKELVVVRWDKEMKNALATAIENAGDDIQAMVKALNDMAERPGVGWGSNPILMARIEKAIGDADSAASAAEAIRSIKTVNTISKDIPKAVAKQLASLGYSVATPSGGRKTPVVDYSDTRKLISSISRGEGDEVFDATISPNPSLESLSSGLRRFGLSPESNTSVAYEKLVNSLISNLNATGAAKDIQLIGDESNKGGKFILSRLQAYIDTNRPNHYLNVLTLNKNAQSALQDIRQMNTEKIMDALPGVSRQSAKDLQAAIRKAYTDVPLEFRGLGPKAWDYAYKFPGAGTYFRIQSALRYTYNPFFKVQELTETKILAHMKANNLVWMKSRAELDDAAKLLDDSKIFTMGNTGEATQDLTVGRIHANLLPPQRRDVAGLALDIAEKRGITLERMVRDYPEELVDALRVIVQYPTRGVLNSPLARTLNIAFFPMRYNLKVAGMVAQEVGKLPPTVQTAFIHSTMKLNDWLKSPEGIQWQSDNSDAIQVFKYITPYSNIESVMKTLLGSNNSIGEFGLLGGLPFGFISQILDSEGIISMNTPYVNPRTGEVLPNKIPLTMKAKAATALQGLINSMFTYPGRILGMPGKTQFVRNQVDTFLKTGNNEYLKNVRSQDLTPLQRRWVEVLNNPNVNQEQLDALYTSPAPEEFNWYTLPPTNLPQPVKVLTRQEVAAMKAAQGGSGRREKPKALPIPKPGQPLQ